MLRELVLLYIYLWAGTGVNGHITVLCSTTPEVDTVCDVDSPHGVTIWLGSYHRNQSGTIGPGPVFQGNFSVVADMGKYKHEIPINTSIQCRLFRYRKSTTFFDQ